MSIRIGILGYGNLGRGVECAVREHEDMELVAVFCRMARIIRSGAKASARVTMQKWAGYMLVGSAPEEKMLFLYGEGGTGKGTFISTIGYMLGDYADTLDIEVFLSSRNDGHAGGSGPSPEIAKLAGVRLAVASESGLGRKLNDAKVKNMTGRDDLTARYFVCNTYRGYI